MPRARPATPEEIGDGKDRLMDPHSPEVPAGVRTKVLAIMQPGDQLWRCPRLTGKKTRLGLFGTTVRREATIEWWLLDADGELIEAFWEEV